MGNIITSPERYFTYTCKKDNLKKAQKFISKLDNKKKNNKYYNIASMMGAKNIVNWLSNIDDTFIIYDDTLNNIMINNYLDIFIILVNKNIIKLNDRIFEKACKYNLNFVKWIFIMCKEININNNEKPFMNACNYNKFNIIKYLIENNYNYEIYDDYIFVKLCEEKKEEIINYLCTICPRYNYIKYNNYYQPIIIDKITHLIHNSLWDDLIKETKMSRKKNFKSEECSISLEQSDMITNCNHHFQLTYLMKWYNKKNTCPICNTKINLNNCIIDDKINFIL